MNAKWTPVSPSNATLIWPATPAVLSTNPFNSLKKAQCGFSWKCFVLPIFFEIRMPRSSSLDISRLKFVGSSCKSVAIWRTKKDSSGWVKNHPRILALTRDPNIFSIVGFMTLVVFLTPSMVIITTFRYEEQAHFRIQVVSPKNFSRTHAAKSQIKKLSSFLLSSWRPGFLNTETNSWIILTNYFFELFRHKKRPRSRTYRKEILVN